MSDRLIKGEALTFLCLCTLICIPLLVFSSSSSEDIEPFRLKYDVSTAAKLTQQENSLVELRNYEMYKAGSSCLRFFSTSKLSTIW